MFKPLEIFNDIVNGLILGIYDIVILTVGPLIALFRRRRCRIWRFILRVENRVNSLTMLFVYIAGVVTANIPELVTNVAEQSLHLSRQTQSYFVQVLVISIALTVFFDVLFRILVYLRSVSLGVNFSNLRLIALRLYFCSGLLAMIAGDLILIILWRGENQAPSQPPNWADSAVLLFTCLAAMPFSATILHLTYRWRGWPKWLAIIPFTYSFISLSYALGIYVGLFVLLFAAIRVDPELTQLYSFNTRCSLADEKTVAVDADLVLQTDSNDAVTLENIFADVGNQIIELHGVGGTENILVPGKPTPTKWQGSLLQGVDRPALGTEPTPCKLERWEALVKEPTRVEIAPDD